MFGNVRQFGYQKNAGDLDFAWMNEYGAAYRIGGTLGEDILMVSDPKALQHMLHKSGYNYPKNVETTVGVRLVSGKGILWASGHTHQRQRKIMSPAFTAPQLKSFLPLFRRISGKMCQQWNEEYFSKSPAGQTIAVNTWLARVTLDVIGEAAFDFKFGALDDDENEVSEVYKNMFVDSVMHPTIWNTLFRSFWRHMPSALLEYVGYIPTREYTRFRKAMQVIGRVSKQLIDEKTKSYSDGDDTRKDAMSVLVRANISENPKTRISEEEMISQMAVLILAGHETTASTSTWFLWELAKHPEFQDKLREEVMAVRSQISARGDSELTIEDLDGMVYLPAAMKETLRFHPIVYHLGREAAKDDVIPLSKPVYGKSGEMISEIPVTAGQNIMISICAYNRLPDVWGNDANEWNPMRFVDASEEKQVKVGILANLMTFSAGIRGCIGWRFSVIEMQAIMFDLVENFKFALAEDKPDILRVPMGIMGPMVEGKMHEGVQLPLRVTPLN
ncbi:hypothetical protein EW026_g4830 [Hermanssonia centrifuga]|uniref:Cytochrome P450 n=1 Tax=Hermanssonia centrifuga TaxID=98765 RepID=A0A4S4KFZ2_9APHY|nr:hypothetical protein EW026_g4830 [Hermanssonia centrifuga]